MTGAGNYKLKIILTDWSGVTKYALYGLFRMADESHEYSLSIWGCSGTAGDDMDYHDGMDFQRMTEIMISFQSTVQIRYIMRAGGGLDIVLTKISMGIITLARSQEV